MAEAQDSHPDSIEGAPGERALVTRQADDRGIDYIYTNGVQAQNLSFTRIGYPTRFAFRALRVVAVPRLICAGIRSSYTQSKRHVRVRWNETTCSRSRGRNNMFEFDGQTKIGRKPSPSLEFRWQTN
jgi:hypothetical protein